MKKIILIIVLIVCFAIQGFSKPIICVKYKGDWYCLECCWYITKNGVEIKTFKSPIETIKDKNGIIQVKNTDYIKTNNLSDFKTIISKINKELINQKVKSVN